MSAKKKPVKKSKRDDLEGDVFEVMWASLLGEFSAKDLPDKEVVRDIMRQVVEVIERGMSGAQPLKAAIPAYQPLPAPSVLTEELRKVREEVQRLQERLRGLELEKTSLIATSATLAKSRDTWKAVGRSVGGAFFDLLENLAKE